MLCFSERLVDNEMKSQGEKLCSGNCLTHPTLAKKPIDHLKRYFDIRDLDELKSPETFAAVSLFV